jgi:PhnB protein
MLKEGGDVFMPIQETFFAGRFAMCRDRFGTSWMIIGAQKTGSQGDQGGQAARKEQPTS